MCRFRDIRGKRFAILTPYMSLNDYVTYELNYVTRYRLLSWSFSLLQCDIYQNIKSLRDILLILWTLHGPYVKSQSLLLDIISKVRDVVLFFFQTIVRKFLHVFVLYVQVRFMRLKGHVFKNLNSNTWYATCL